MPAAGINILTDYAMRGGEHPHEETNQIEEEISTIAMQEYLSNPHFKSKTLRWSYNFKHFHTIYSTGHPMIRDWMYKHRPYPQHIEIEPTTACDIKCTMCEHTWWDHEKIKTLRYDEYTGIMEQFPQLQQIGLTGIGTSYLNPWYMKMIDYCTERDIGIELFDTFKDLNEERAEHLIRSSAYKVYVSLDAATKETYEKIRVGSSWDRVMSNVKTFDRVKKRLKAHFPIFCFHYIITKYNIHECIKYLEMVKDLNIDVAFCQFSRMLHPYAEALDQFVHIPKGLEAAVRKRGAELGIEIVWNGNATLEEDKATMDKCTVWEQPFIFSDGTVIPCCSLNEENDRDHQRNIASYGNVLEKDFREIWQGWDFQNMIDHLDQGKTAPNCVNCILYRLPEGPYYGEATKDGAASIEKYDAECDIKYDDKGNIDKVYVEGELLHQVENFKV